MYVIRNITKELVEKGKIFSTLQERSNKRLYSAESLKIKNHPLDFTPEESLCRLLDVCVMNGIKASRENARA